MRVIQALGAKAHGGAETLFVNLCLGLAEAGLDQRIVIRHHAERLARLRDGGLTVHELPFRGRLDPMTGPMFRRIARAYRPDIVMTWMNRASLQVPRGRYVKAARIGGYYDLKYYRTCDWLVAITPKIADHLAAGGWPRERIRVIPNFPRIEPCPPVRRADLDTPDGVPLLLSLGRLHRNKAFDVLLHALVRLPDAHLWIAGDGPEEHALKRLAQDLGVAGRVRFLGWRADRSALMDAADICVFPSRHEPLGSVTVEAWAQRVPLVAAAADGPAWLVRDGEDGLLVPIDDAGALARAVGRIIADPALAQELADRGYRRYATEFSQDRIVAAYLDFYHAITA